MSSLFLHIYISKIYTYYNKNKFAYNVYPTAIFGSSSSISKPSNQRLLHDRSSSSLYSMP